MPDEARAPLLGSSETRPQYGIQHSAQDGFPVGVQQGFLSREQAGDCWQAEETESQVEVDPVPHRELRVYKRRFYIVALFSLFAGCQGAIWNVFGPIAAVSEDMFGWNDGTIALLGNWGPIAYVISAVFFSWMMQVKGLRLSVLLCSFLVATGSVLRCITTANPLVTWFAHIAQFLNGLAGPVAMAGPPVVSSIWFPAGQRTTATALTNFLLVFVMSSNFIAGPHLVPLRNTTDVNGSQGDVHFASAQNRSAADIDAEKKDFLVYMYILAGISGLIFLLILAYFPDRPPQCPSLSASIARENFFSGLRSLTRKRQYWLIAFIYGVPQGVVACWGTVLDVDLKPHGIDQNDAGWIGFYASICACTAGLIMARFSDSFLRYMKWITLALYTLGLGCLVWLALVLIDVLPSSTPVLYVTVIGGGSALCATSPLLFEMGCECAYPVSESTANGVLTLVNNTAGLIFMFVLMVPNLDMTWMNWILVGSVAVSIPALLILRDTYNRLTVDENSPLPPPE